LAEDFAARLSGALVQFALHVQKYVGELLTPIEDGAVERQESPSPWLPAATLTIPVQNLLDAASQSVRDRVDALAFSPWHAPGRVLAARQPQPGSSSGLRRQRPRLADRCGQADRSGECTAAARDQVLVTRWPRGLLSAVTKGDGSDQSCGLQGFLSSGKPGRSRRPRPTRQ
jgi:hypothetical protein